MLGQFQQLGFVSVVLVQLRGFDSVVFAFVRSCYGKAMTRVDEKAVLRTFLEHGQWLGGGGRGVCWEPTREAS